MSANDDPCLHWLQRSYYYLRLSGADSVEACCELRRMMEALSQAGDDPVLREQARARLWQRLRQDVDQAIAIEPDLPPRLERGHVRYPPAEV